MQPLFEGQYKFKYKYAYPLLNTSPGVEVISLIIKSKEGVPKSEHLLAYSLKKLVYTLPTVMPFVCPLIVIVTSLSHVPSP